MLAIVEAKKRFFPVHKDKNGELYVDKQGNPKPRMVPSGYLVTFNHGVSVSVTTRKGKTTYTVKQEGYPIRDMFNNPTGEMTKETIQMQAVSANEFKRRHNHNNMFSLVQEGVEQAEIEAQAKRAA